jgi:hypothetical protein
MATIIRVGGGAGGGLVFTVVGGTTLPSSPSENTVWVNTSTAINNVYAQVFEPTSPAVGDVWINTWVNLDSEGKPLVSDVLTMTVSESPLIRISARSGQQWDGSEWKTLTTRVYKNGAWSPDVFIIIMDGEWGNLGQPTKWFKSNTTLNSAAGVTFTHENGYIKAGFSTSGAATLRLYIETPINVTPYNTLTVKGYTPDATHYEMWALVNYELEGYASIGSEDYLTERIKSASVITASADISSAEGNAYAGIGIRSTASGYKPTGYFLEVT